MAQYLLSAHSVEGQAREPMSDEEMPQLMAGVHALEDELKLTGAWVFRGRLHEPDTPDARNSSRAVRCSATVLVGARPGEAASRDPRGRCLTGGLDMRVAVRRDVHHRCAICVAESGRGDRPIA